MEYRLPVIAAASLLLGLAAQAECKTADARQEDGNPLIRVMVCDGEVAQIRFDGKTPELNKLDYVTMNAIRAGELEFEVNSGDAVARAEMHAFVDRGAKILRLEIPDPAQSAAIGRAILSGEAITTEIIQVQSGARDAIFNGSLQVR